MGLEESVCCKQILISGSLKVAVAAVSKSHGLQHGRSKRAKGLLCSKSPVCTLSQNGSGACSVRFGSISGDICQVQFQRWRGLHPGRKEERSTVEASRQAISMLLAARRQSGSSGRIAAGRK